MTEKNTDEEITKIEKRLIKLEKDFESKVTKIQEDLAVIKEIREFMKKEGK